MIKFLLLLLAILAWSLWGLINVKSMIDYQEEKMMSMSTKSFLARMILSGPIIWIMCLLAFITMMKELKRDSPKRL